MAQGGFQHILGVFMQCSLPTDETPSQEAAVELKFIAFMLRLLKTFTFAAFSTRDTDAY